MEIDCGIVSTNVEISKRDCDSCDYNSLDYWWAVHQACVRRSSLTGVRSCPVTGTDCEAREASSVKQGDSRCDC